MKSVRLVLPFPPRDLSPNVRVHWAVKAASARNYRGLCKVEALNAANRRSIKLQPPVRARVLFVCGSRLWDQDNCTAAFKAGWDGIVESGLIPDDNPEVLQVVETLVQKGTKREVRVLLEADE